MSTTKTEPYDGEDDDQSVEQARQDLGLGDPEDGEALTIPPEGGFPAVGIDNAIIAKLDLGPRDVLTLVLPEGIDDAVQLSYIAHGIGEQLKLAGHPNLVLAFPAGTKVKKVTLSDAQMNDLRRQVGVEGDEPAAPSTPFGGFERPQQ